MRQEFDTAFRILRLCMAGAIPCSPRAAAPIEIAGEQDGIYEQGPYLATGDIVIGSGRTLEFEPGTVVRFEPYCGIVVRGTLVCSGTPAAPVVFTSATDVPSSEGAEGAQPFDWNGIQVDAGGMVSFSYVKVSYSTFGVEADTDSKLRLHKAVFVKNGRSSLSVGEEIMQVDDAESVDFVHPPVEIKPPGRAAAEPPRAEPVPARTRKKGAWKLPVRIGLGAVAAVGCALWAGGHYKAVDSQDRYEAASYPRADEYREDRDRFLQLRNIGTVVCGVGAVGFGVTFSF